MNSVRTVFFGYGEKAKCLSSVKILKDVTQLDLEKFQVLGQNLGSGETGRVRVESHKRPPRTR